jgi:hypothetical protein
MATAASEYRLMLVTSIQPSLPSRFSDKARLHLAASGPCGPIGAPHALESDDLLILNSAMRRRGESISFRDSLCRLDWYSGIIV